MTDHIARAKKVCDMYADFQDCPSIKRRLPNPVGVQWGNA